MAFIDRRELVFDSDAVITVIDRSPTAARWLSLPSGRPSAVHFRPDQGQVEIVVGAGAGARGFVVQSDALAALLIGYCLRARIPMPRQATKGVSLRADGIVLRFQLSFPEPPLADLPEAQGGGAHPGRARSFAWSTAG